MVVCDLTQKIRMRESGPYPALGLLTVPDKPVLLVMRSSQRAGVCTMSMVFILLPSLSVFISRTPLLSRTAYSLYRLAIRVSCLLRASRRLCQKQQSMAAQGFLASHCLLRRLAWDVSCAVRT